MAKLEGGIFLIPVVFLSFFRLKFCTPYKWEWKAENFYLQQTARIKDGWICQQMVTEVQNVNHTPLRLKDYWRKTERNGMSFWFFII